MCLMWIDRIRSFNIINGVSLSFSCPEYRGLPMNRWAGTPVWIPQGRKVHCSHTTSAMPYVFLLHAGRLNLASVMQGKVGSVRDGMKGTGMERSFSCNEFQTLNAGHNHCYDCRISISNYHHCRFGTCIYSCK